MKEIPRSRPRVTRRCPEGMAQLEVFKAGDLTVDFLARTVEINGKQTELTPMEYSLLRLFVQNAGKVLTHRQIFCALWESAQTNDIGYTRVHLTSLREKLASQLIVTEPGIGYRLALQE